MPQPGLYSGWIAPARAKRTGKLTDRGLMKNFRPEVEERIRQFHATHGATFFGGALKSEADYTKAIPDSLGGEVPPQVAAPGA